MTLPEKLIKEYSDMEGFQTSPARQRLCHIIDQLSKSVVGFEIPDELYESENPLVRDTCTRFIEAGKVIDQIPPLETPQRFGNPSYRTWLDAVETVFKTGNDELDYYILNAFGSAQRIDFGTGHELNFIAYWDGSVRTKELEKQTSEPAGSHGVWGLDDHFHLPYILGAAQLSSLSPEEDPKPKDVLNSKVIALQRSSNLYFAAISFINNVKKGPFFEHSPILFDVSSIKSWSKVKGGMIKMYHGEVLSKFPVVQHFYFGSLFPFKSN